MEVSCQLQAPGASFPRKISPRTHWIGVWLGSRAGLDVVVKKKSHIVHAGNWNTVIHRVINFINRCAKSVCQLEWYTYM